MKIVFFGSSDFSCPILEKLCGAHEVLAVITTPAKPRGRGLKLLANPVETMATSKGLPCFAPPKLKDGQMREKVLALGCDVFVVASYGKILPPDWLSIPRKYPLNIHPSMLPQYRGAAPVNWQLIRGERAAGVTIFKMSEGLDSGDIALQREVPLDAEEDAVSLLAKTSAVSGDMILEALHAVARDEIRFLPQNAEAATLAPKLKREDGLIDWTKPAREIANRIRGLVPWPCAYTLFKGEMLQILKARSAEENGDGANPGKVLEINKSGFIRVGTGCGGLLVEKMKPAGKREMTAHEFAIGRRIENGMHFGSL